jgi:hypothetical protein
MNNTLMTIAEAAEKWIAMVESLPNAKATREQKDAQIAKIQAAAPLAKLRGAASFTTATNAIKAAMVAA